VRLDEAEFGVFPLTNPRRHPDAAQRLAGVGNRIEIWSAAEYQRTLTPLSERAGLQAVARHLFDQKKPGTGAE
jgi:hypothetical protein